MNDETEEPLGAVGIGLVNLPEDAAPAQSIKLHAYNAGR
jgi:hypothetical protein